MTRKSDMASSKNLVAYKRGQCADNKKIRNKNTQKTINL